MDRYHHVRALHGEAGYAKLSAAKVLVVGAGGIGCEILKNLAFSGIRQLDLIDLDTIDVSNLNRQFLFRPEHVGLSKAIVAGDAAKKFNPDLVVHAHHDNIKNHRFGVEYFKSFDVVMNALDNVDARRHVNRLCLAAEVPLVDSGTTGYLGQVTPIFKGITACYECHPKPTQKVYPICTIRSTPDKPVHCIVWAKELFKLLFGPRTESMLFEDEAATGEKSSYMHLLTTPSVLTPDALLPFTEQLLLGLFRDETQKRIDMGVYKTAKAAPEPLATEAIAEAVAEVRGAYASVAAGTPLPLSPQLKHPDWDHQRWSVSANVGELVVCLLEAFLDAGTRELVGQLGFDKDDMWAMRFVTAASNLRAHMFHIPLQSFHDAKGIAGNIIPAIATTNAIIAAAQMQAATNVLLHLPKATIFSGDISPERRQFLYQEVRRLAPHTYCLRAATRRGHYLEPSEPEEPNAACYVCNTAQLSLQIDTDKATLGELVAKVLKGRLGFNETNVMVGSSILYEEGEDCDEDLRDNLIVALAACPGGGIRDGGIVTVEDFSQKLEVKLVIKHVSEAELRKDEKSQEAVDLFVLEGQQAYQQRVQQQQAQAQTQEGQAQVEQEQVQETSPEEDDCVVIVDEVMQVVGADRKRALDSDEVEPSAKRSKAH